MESNAEQHRALRRRAGPALWRALRSTLVITAVAVTLFSVRHHGLSVAEISRVAVRYSPLWLMVFVGLLIWDYWSEHRRGRGR